MQSVLSALPEAAREQAETHLRWLNFNQAADGFIATVRKSPHGRYRLECHYEDAAGNLVGTVTHELAAGVSMVLPGTAEEVEAAERALRVASAMQAIDALVRNAPLALAPAPWDASCQVRIWGFELEVGLMPGFVG